MDARGSSFLVATRDKILHIILELLHTNLSTLMSVAKFIVNEFGFRFLNP